MKEIELRLAFVFYGGVSLAIYMHGVSREALNLVRASGCRSARIGRNGVYPASNRALSGAECAYEALLDRLGREVDVRVVVDAIAGASAGGVNGIMLARAIAHDLPLNSHKSLWLENADVTRLARPQSGLRRYLKSTISPVLDQLISQRLSRYVDNAEAREKLRTLMQSRWFSPPFSGENYIGWMLDACAKMDDGFQDGATLIPRGQTLDLFVTLTDYHGQLRRIRIDDPDYVEEWDHRRVLNFHAIHRTAQSLKSQFGPDCVPDLVFAARATSSFPGAFPPATIQEMDRVLKNRNEQWQNREAFLRRGLELSDDLAGRRCFVDGSVVMNKPFAPVIDVIRRRPAAKAVARRLLYVDPVPSDQEQQEGPGEALPGFFKVILSSLAHIPRNEPIGDDLREIEVHNRRGRRLAETISAADPVVETAVQKIMPRWSRLSTDKLTRCRQQANREAHRQAGYAFLNYQSLKLHAVGDRVADLLVRLTSEHGEAVPLERVKSAITAYLSGLAGNLVNGPPDPDDGLVQFLRALDVDYRIRRLRFAIRRLNSFYQRIGTGSEDIQPEGVDHLKSHLYEQIDHLGRRWEMEFYGQCRAALAGSLARADDAGAEDCDWLIPCLDQLGTLMGLAELDQLHDELFAETARAFLPGKTYREFLGAYVGFAFYDLVIFPVLRSNDFS